MKKFITVSVLLALLLPLVACGGSKTSISAGDFITQMEGAGFEVLDVSDEYPQDLIEAVVIATNEHYQLEYFAVPSVNQAKAAFLENKQSFENDEGDGVAASHSSSSGSNYEIYKRNANGKYYVVSRIDNTFLYVVTEKENKKSVEDMFDALGY